MRTKSYSVGTFLLSGPALAIFATVLTTFAAAYVSASIFAPTDNSFATDSGSTEATVSFDFAPTIDISVDKSALNLAASGTEFNKMLTGNINVTVSTNNVTGYTLNMSTDSSATNGATTDAGTNVATNALVNTTNNRFYVPSITATSINPTDSTFPTNSWGYSLNASSDSADNIAYNAFPAAGSESQIKKVTSLDFPTTGNSEAVADDATTVTVAAKVDMSVPAGAYTNTLVFTAVTNYNDNFDNYTITYDGNGADGGDMSMVSHSNVKEGDSVTLYAQNYWREGYGFLGWSFDQNATPSGNARIYGPQETITAPYLSNEENQHKTLYAVWQASAGTLQNWQGCASMSVGDVTALTDNRDNNTYAVAKLADKKCWFAENLRLDDSAVLNNTNTDDLGPGFTALPASSNSFGSSSAGYSTVAQFNSTNTDPNLSADASAATASQWYGYGNYYSWPAAIASTQAYTTYHDNAETSICPKGWILPTGSTEGDYHLLYAEVGNDNYAFARYPYNFVHNGGWYGNTSNWRNEVGIYLTSTNYNDTTVYRLSARLGSSTSPQDTTGKIYGFGVRCRIAGNSTITYNANGGSGDMSSAEQTDLVPGADATLIAPNFWRDGYSFIGWSTNPNATVPEYGPNQTIAVPNMQNIIMYAIWREASGVMQTWDQCGSMQVGDVVSLTDNRDGNAYSVAKFIDNQCWMISNLRLDGTADINSDNTQALGSGFTGLPQSDSDFTSDSYTEIAINTESTNTALPASHTNVRNTSWYSYGNLYSWAAAIASTATYETSGENVNTSICPKGWRLPKGSSSGEYHNLNILLSGDNTILAGSEKLREYPYNFDFPGAFIDGNYSNRGGYGAFWSSTVSSAEQVWFMSLNDNHVYPNNHANKNIGRSIRCVKE